MQGRYGYRGSKVMITILKPNEVFVFGSNLAGNHAGGAAQQALEQFGAIQGCGEGLRGHSYAFPTLNRNMQKRAINELKRSRNRFYKLAKDLPKHTFLMTAVGTGIAGYKTEVMAKLFKNPPSNVVLPKEFINIGKRICCPDCRKIVEVSIHRNRCKPCYNDWFKEVAIPLAQAIKDFLKGVKK